MRLRGTVQKRPAQRISLSDKPRRKFRAVSFVAAVMAAVLTASAGIGAYAADAETVPPIKYTVMESGSEDSAAESSIGQMSDVEKLQGAKYPAEEAARKNAQEAQEEEAAGTEETAQGEETALSRSSF